MAFMPHDREAFAFAAADRPLPSIVILTCTQGQLTPNGTFSAPQRFGCAIQLDYKYEWDFHVR